jgi:hypothetical protein
VVVVGITAGVGVHTKPRERVLVCLRRPWLSFFQCGGMSCALLFYSLSMHLRKDNVAGVEGSQFQKSLMYWLSKSLAGLAAHILNAL